MKRSRHLKPPLYAKLIRVVIALFLVLTLGVVGYRTFEGWRTLDALYMTVITIASVGFSEVHKLTDVGRIFTMFLILFGSGVLVYGVSTLTAIVVEGELTDTLRRRKMQKAIDKLRGHFIVCGAGQTGRYIIDELVKLSRDFVVVEKDRERVKALLDQDILCIEGDATQDAILHEAQVERAHGLVTVLHSDAVNLFVALTARHLNPHIRIVAKSVEDESEQKLRAVGADVVVSTNRIGGLRLVSEMIRPTVTSFLDIMLRSKDVTLRMDEITVHEGSHCDGKTLEETGFLDVEGVSVVALKSEDQDTFHYNPPKHSPLKAGNIIIVMGNVHLINSMREKALPPHMFSLHLKSQ